MPREPPPFPGLPQAPPVTFGAETISECLFPKKPVLIFFFRKVDILFSYVTPKWLFSFFSKMAPQAKSLC